MILLNIISEIANANITIPKAGPNQEKQEQTSGISLGLGQMTNPASKLPVSNSS